MDASLFGHFVIMNLKELSAEQQRRAIAHQLDDSEQFMHLAAFGQIRQARTLFAKVVNAWHCPCAASAA